MCCHMSNVIRNRSAVVKVGSDTLMTSEGHLDTHYIQSILVEQLMEIKEVIGRLVLVSSGAVPAGRWKYGVKKRPHESTRLKSKWASAGQSILINTYNDALAARDCICNQFLVTRSNYFIESERRHIHETLEDIFADEMRGLPVFNENDTVATQEIFTDNDQLASLVAMDIRAQDLVILSNVPGLMRNYPDTSSVIHRINPLEHDAYQYISEKKSDNGTGGMETKVDVAIHLLEAIGCKTHIAYGREPHILRKILLQGENPGTTFANE